MKVKMERMEMRQISDDDLSPPRQLVCSFGHYGKAVLVATTPLAIQLDCKIPPSWGNERLERAPAETLIGIIHFIKELVPSIPPHEWMVITLRQVPGLREFSFLLTPSTLRPVSEVRMRRWPIVEEGRMEEVDLPFLTE